MTRHPMLHAVLIALLCLSAPASHAADGDSLCPGPAPAPPVSGLCDVLPGGGAGLLVRGTLLTPDGALENGQLLIGADGRVACSACDCSAEPDAADATVLSCPDAIVSPGLIDSINRLAFSQNPSWVPPDPDERYSHRHEWRHGQNGATQITAVGAASSDQLRWGELRSMMAGVTAAVSSGWAQGFMLRNLERSAEAAALGESAVETATFPLGDAGGATRTDDCAYNTLSVPAPGVTVSQVVAEGLDDRARNEILCLSGQRPDAVQGITGSAIQHGIGLTLGDLQHVRAAGASLVWQPRTQISVYGDTAPVLAALRLGIPVALGTNWTVTGSYHLGRELACARSLDAGAFDGALGDRALWRMVTSDAARSAGMDGALGALLPGAAGDLLLVPRVPGEDPYTTVVGADTAAIALVLRDGVPLYGDDALLVALGAGDGACDALDVCGNARRLCVTRESAGLHTLASLTAALPAGTPALFFCTPPPNERTCTPQRSAPFAYGGVPAAGDADGDGVPDAQDLCPTVFNPPRLVDGGEQADADGDGVGDACDACPQLPGTAACPDALQRDSFEASQP